MHAEIKKDDRLLSGLRFLLAGALIAVSLMVFVTAKAKADVFTAIDVDIPKARLPAPAFLLNDLQGKKVALSDFRGKLILLNFWATWCKPCRDEMPAMQRLWEKYRDRGLIVLTISADKKSMSVQSFVDKNRLDFPVLLDITGDVRTSYEVIALPMSYLIAADGKISGRLISARDWGSKQAFDLIEALLP